MAYNKKEKRTHPRVKGRFVVSYRLFEESGNVDISQTKDISLGGMYLTTNRQFSPGAKLALEIRLPFDPNPIKIIGKVVESREISRNLIYVTRIQFLDVDEKHGKIISETVNYYIKKGS